MTEKEKLVNLIKKSMYSAVPVADIIGVADYLLKNGVTVLPVKVGDTVYTNVSWRGWYSRDKGRPYEVKVAFIGISKKKPFMNVAYEENDSMLSFTFTEIGKTIFLTREGAEKALKESEENA